MNNPLKMNKDLKVIQMMRFILQLSKKEIRNQKAIEDHAKAEAIETERNEGKYFLYIAFGQDVVEAFFKKRIKYNRYYKTLLNIRSPSPTTSCDILNNKGPIDMKINKHDGTDETIPGFKMAKKKRRNLDEAQDYFKLTKRYNQSAQFGFSSLTQNGMIDFVPSRAVIDAAHHKWVKYEAKCADIEFGFLRFFIFFAWRTREGCGDPTAADSKVLLTLLKRIRRFSVTQDIGARAAGHIFNRIGFAIAIGVGAQIVSQLPTTFL
ncbi:hypothetical protein Tco_0329334 [Tanacetum coccineum]